MNRPTILKILISLLIVNFFLGFFSSYFFIDMEAITEAIDGTPQLEGIFTDKNIRMFVIVANLINGIIAFAIYYGLWIGVNWVRIVYLIINFISLPFSLFGILGIANSHPFQIFQYLFAVLLTGFAIITLLTNPVKSYFTDQNRNDSDSSNNLDGSCQGQDSSTDTDED